ncbi:MAG: hypothetical protein D3916_07655 [Candidatus Electrothrix sp. MAN1_4]|nr:hypothetical protein [Candidatus Electrothrix sp. MAN1_4]
MANVKEIFLGAAVGALGSILTAVFVLGGQWERWVDIRDTYQNKGAKEKVESNKTAIDSTSKKIDNHIQNHPTGPSTPKNIVGMFYQESCPEGWEEVSNMNGRYIVGVTSNGARIGETIGTPLKPQENRVVGKHGHPLGTTGNHTHSVANAGNHAHSFSGARDYTSGAGDHDRAKPTGASRSTNRAGNHSHGLGTSGQHTHSLSDAGNVEGTNAPYIQLLACRKK